LSAQAFAAPFEPRAFRIAPQLRRCVYYVIAGAILGASVAWWAESTLKMHGGLHVVLVVFALFGLATAYPLSWRLELDDEGLVRRRLLLRDRWRWDDFASGRIRKPYRFVLVDPERPWWRRTLSLDHVAEADRRQVLAALNRHYRLPDPSPLLDALMTKFRLWKIATFGRDGIQIVDGGRPCDYRWADVRHLHIARSDAVRRDFSELNLVLPDREIGMRILTHQGGTSPSWRGASAEEINDFLLAYVPRDRASVDLVGERAPCQRDVEREMTRLRSAMRMGISLCALLAAFMLVGLAIEGPQIRALFRTVATIGFLFYVALILWRGHVKEMRKLALWRIELESERPIAKAR
jgi:hypothetical protein